ncbi:MAG: glycosyltransferase family 2 protein [Balneolaceae bacterium]
MTGVIILNYFTCEDTIALYRQIVEFPDLIVLVVDNSCDTEEADELKAVIPEEQLLISPQNMGYAGGNNLGILSMLDHPEVDLVALLNPDVCLEGNILPALREMFEVDPELAAAGPRLCIRGSDEEIIYSDGGILAGERFLKPSHIHGRLPVHEAEPSIGRKIDYVNGSFIVMRVDAIRDIGMFDENFFLYFEEVDWCTRARKKGWKLQVNPGFTAFQRISEKGTRYNYYYYRGWFLYLHKYDKKSILPLLFHQLKKIKWKLQNRDIPWERRIEIAWSRFKGVMAGVFNF